MSIFTGGWWGHPEYKLPPELNLIAVAHYLEALDIQAEAAAIIAVMGGKFPHFMTSLPGGTAWVPTEEKLDGIIYRLKKIKSFVDEALDPRHARDRAVLPRGHEVRQGRRQLPRVGRVRGQERWTPRTRFLPARLDPRRRSCRSSSRTPDKIMEYVEHSWYTADSGNLNPRNGVTNAAFGASDTQRPVLVGQGAAPRRARDGGRAARPDARRVRRRRRRTCSRDRRRHARRRSARRASPRSCSRCSGAWRRATSRPSSSRTRWSSGSASSSTRSRAATPQYFTESQADRGRRRGPVGGAARRAGALDAAARAARSTTTRSSRRRRGTCRRATPTASAGRWRRRSSATPVADVGAAARGAARRAQRSTLDSGAGST